MNLQDSKVTGFSLLTELHGKKKDESQSKTDAIYIWLSTEVIAAEELKCSNYIGE